MMEHEGWRNVWYSRRRAEGKRPKRKWEIGIKQGLTGTEKGVEWVHLPRDRGHCQALENKLIIFGISATRGIS